MYQHILICFRMHGKLGWTCIFFSSDSVNPLVDLYISYFESNKRVALPHLSCDHDWSRYLFQDSLLNSWMNFPWVDQQFPCLAHLISTVWCSVMMPVTYSQSKLQIAGLLATSEMQSHFRNFLLEKILEKSFPAVFT